MESIGKVKIVRIAGEFLPTLLGVGIHLYEVAEGVPDDVEIVNCRLGWTTNVLELVLKSEQFEEIETGEPIPELAIRITPPSAVYVPRGTSKVLDIGKVSQAYRDRL